MSIDKNNKLSLNLIPGNWYFVWVRWSKELNTFDFLDEDVIIQKEHTISVEVDIILKEALNTLTILQQNVIIYKFIIGYSDAEIGDILSISRQAVNRIINRGLLRLRKYMSC